jgi:hypothetical protein
MTLAEFIEKLQEACNRSGLVASYDLRVLDNTVLKARITLASEAFIDVYYNPTNGAISYTLVQAGQRIYGADNAFIGWHIHPFENPLEHRSCKELPFHEFLEAVELWVSQDAKNEQRNSERR